MKDIIRMKDLELFILNNVESIINNYFIKVKFLKILFWFNAFIKIWKTESIFWILMLIIKRIFWIFSLIKLRKNAIRIEFTYKLDFYILLWFMTIDLTLTSIVDSNIIILKMRMRSSLIKK
jgi:hypothetical protein